MRLFSNVSERVSDPWLRRAFMLAERGRGTTSPNPVVGCVLVRDDAVVGEGYHERAGGPHAEVAALAAAHGAAPGSIAYVTLEPCAHHGRTPPCTEAFINAGISSVVIGMRDPNPGVTGGGAEVLRAAGIAVRFAEDPTPFEDQNDAWLASLETGRPFVRAKVALSLDGHPALTAGARSALTGASGATVTRTLRERADAVLIGASTLAVDDPALTARDPDGVVAARQPVRAVISRTSLPVADARMFADGAGPVAALVPEGLAQAAAESLPQAVRVLSYDADAGLAAALASLGALGLVDVLCEPGPRLFAMLKTASLIDELIVVHAGGMAGSAAPELYAGEPDVSPDDPSCLLHALAPVEAGIVGDVVVTVWRPDHTSTSADSGR